MKTYAICGSMRFEGEMRKIAYWLETKMGCNALQCVYADEGACPTEEERERFERAHFLKIDLSDGIYVVNIDRYIGQAVSREIEYAKRRGKEVLYHCK